MLSAAVVARELTSPDNGSSDLSDSIQEALAADYEDSSESEFTVENTTVTVHATAPGSNPITAGDGGISEGVSTGGELLPPRNIWGPEEERLAQGLAQASTVKHSGRPAVREPQDRRQDKEATALPSLTDKLLEMLRQDEIRREEDRQRRLQDEARRDQREKEQQLQRLQENAEQRRAIEALIDSARALSQAGPEIRHSPIRSGRDQGFGPPPPPGHFPEATSMENIFPLPESPGRVSPALSVAHSVLSMGGSRYQSNLHKHFHRLKTALMAARTVNGQSDVAIGGKQLVHIMKELGAARKELEAAWDRAETQGDQPEELREQVEAAIDEVPHLERQVAAAQDHLEEEEKLQRVRLSQRPKQKFSPFHGRPEQWKVFMGDCQEIYQLFQDPQQRLLQIATLCLDKDIKDLVLTYSGGGPASPDKAIAALKASFGSSHLNAPVILQRLKDTPTAHNVAEISATCNNIIGNLEALSNLDGTHQIEPQDVLAHIFRALALGRDKQIAVIPLMARTDGVSLAEIREYAQNRYSTFSLLERTLEKTKKEYKESRRAKNTTTGGGALTSVQDPSPPAGGGRGRAKGSKWGTRVPGAGASHGDKDGGGQGQGTQGRKQEGSGTQGRYTPSPKCALCVTPSVPHWTEMCKYLTASSKQALKLASVCLGCLRQKNPNGAPHQCPSWLRNAQSGSFCPRCSTHVKLCSSPAAHTAVPVPPTFTGFLANRPSSAAGPAQGAGRRRGPNVAILGPQQTCLTPQNKGQIGSAASLTSLITIKRGGDLVTVAALFDSGSESSYCHPDLERLGVTRQNRNFTLETLSMGGEQESVKGLLIGFDILMSDGTLKQVQLI